MSLSTLECDHCGGVAITASGATPSNPGGLFFDGEGEKCASCGMPGHVNVDGDDGDALITWSDDDDGLCTRPACSKCGVERAKEPKP